MIEYIFYIGLVILALGWSGTYAFELDADNRYWLASAWAATVGFCTVFWTVLYMMVM